MRVHESKAFRLASTTQALLVAHFLCGGAQWAAAANADSQAAARQAIVAAKLGVAVVALENPAEFQRARAAVPAPGRGAPRPQRWCVRGMQQRRLGR